MKQRCLALLTILLLLGLASCGMQTPGSNAAKEVAAPTETTETVPETTVPPDGHSYLLHLQLQLKLCMCLLFQIMHC